MCATSARARIGETQFTYNGSGCVSTLGLDIVFRNSALENRPPPLWGVEATNLNISNIEPLWGIIHDDFEGSPGLQTLRRDYLWIPAGMTTNFGVMWDSLASTSISGAVLGKLYKSEIANSNQSPGTPSSSIINRWRTVGNSLEDMANLVNLLYVDNMAQMVVGSKGTKEAFKAKKGDIPVINIRTYQTTIKYDLRYGIPVKPQFFPSTLTSYRRFSF
jgi:hypothetical protein